MQPARERPRHTKEHRHPLCASEEGSRHVGSAHGRPQAVWGTGHSPSEDCQARNLKESALGDGHREVGDAVGTARSPGLPQSVPSLDASGLTQALPPPPPPTLHRPRSTRGREPRSSSQRQTQRCCLTRDSAPGTCPGERKLASTRKHAGGSSWQPSEGQTLETARSPRRDVRTDSGGPAAQWSMTCPCKGNSHKGYNTDETPVKRVRRERPQVAGLLLYKRPEQANP